MATKSITSLGLGNADLIAIGKLSETGLSQVEVADAVVEGDKLKKGNITAGQVGAYTKAEVDTKIADIPTTDLSDYYNKAQVDSLISAIPETDLSNYYDKTKVYNKLESYSKAEVDALITGGGADLSDYYTKAQVDSLIDAIPETDLTNYYNKTQVDSLIDAIPETDLTNYYNKTEVYNKLESYSKAEVDNLIPDINTKQDTLVSATNIKTINGESILGSGDLVISGGGAVDLSGYYNKTETYSKIEVDAKIDGIPETDLSNYYDKSEVDTKIADIPTTDLSGYYNKTEVNNIIDNIPETDLTNYYNKTQVDAIASDKVDKVTGKQLSTEDYTTAEKTKLSGLSNYVKPTSEPISYIDGLQTALGDKVGKVSKQALDSNNALRVTGTTVSLYKGDGTFDSITTQDTVYTHPNSGVTAGTYSKVTVDIQGHITNGSSLLESDIPSLDASKIISGTIDAARLPSFVDDVLEFVNLAGFPTTGEAGKIYIALDTNKTYRWSGSTYVYITSGAVDSVAGKTGVITLTKSDVGLNNVDNTSDTNKPISTATQTALDTKQSRLISGTNIKTINGRSVLGSGDIVITSEEVDAKINAMINAKHSTAYLMAYSN